MPYDLTLSREIAASPATVWRCLTEPELLKQWFAPRPVTITKLELDPTPGGIWLLAMDIPEMGVMEEPAGCVLIAEPEKRIAWTSALGPGFRPNAVKTGEMDFPLTAIMEIEATATGCRYTATALHASEADMKKHEAMGFHDGWGQVADQLKEMAEAGL
ncbi:SRPBCC family protein [Wenxinia marina]|uniref:Wenxma_21, whole genome shotgun sequence n=1 Tax=Wenxinia marina DSM 24838 TaxID=1123501 RepID=A0A0D0NGX2_9RHOB|nr:SRPBCC family protein [Wenxinia marina]KIQ67585.1 hypothetical protein Wenmar_04011 [Wenxinia marina DSM 24838]GGL68278.1 activator of HSP90 ATPase [Wenxinia marina]